MQTDSNITPARIEDAPALRLVGLKESFKFSDMSGIPAFWQRLVPHLKGGQVTYGVSLANGDPEGFDYAAAVEDDEKAPSGPEFVKMEFPAQRYAVFTHPGDVSTLCVTIDGIMHGWFPQSEYTMTADPLMYERYGLGFDPQTMSGDLEIWVPVTRKEA